MSGNNYASQINAGWNWIVTGGSALADQRTARQLPIEVAPPPRLLAGEGGDRRRRWPHAAPLQQRTVLGLQPHARGDLRGEEDGAALRRRARARGRRRRRLRF